jgi:hypothetical protein
VLTNKRDFPALSEAQYLLMQLSIGASALSQTALRVIEHGVDCKVLAQSSGCIHDVQEAYRRVKDVADMLSKIDFPIADVDELFDLSGLSIVEDMGVARSQQLLSSQRSYSLLRIKTVHDQITQHNLFSIFDTSFLDIKLFEQFVIDNPQAIEQLVLGDQLFNQDGSVPVENRHLIISRDYECPDSLELTVNVNVPYSPESDQSSFTEVFDTLLDNFLMSDSPWCFRLQNRPAAELKMSHDQFVQEELRRNGTRS